MLKETRKQEIVRVAAKLFKKKGFSAVTMRDLAKEMGIKAASLYNHIDSKQAILQEIVIAIAEDFTTGMQSIIASDCSSLEKLEQIIQLHVKIAIENTDGLSALNSDWMHLESKLEYYLKLRQDYESNFRHIIETGIASKEIRTVNPDVLMFSMLSTLRTLYLWIPKKGNVNPKELSASLAQILIKGINI
ncbi:TetR family transcriptional regulator [Winogradskyella wandonensis]|uniref:TetR family transcriptional regulator n=1 Tax=Winogradskyella wandonensis TaxID=1442586 RepID=A0A4R1KKB6_9FLAO|nr:TetR/AcrR family transcriptional regulator [Winogradskyella wandonensis]TCK65228.1 TetR family transcriptional regulator [Winogradskyella wandonensis]